MKMGSAHWQVQYQMRRKPWLLLVPLAAAALLVCLIALAFSKGAGDGGEAVTRTVGQSVIDGWVYGGYDSGGNLIFQQGDRVVLLPANSKEIKLNGKAVPLRDSSPDTIHIGLEKSEEAVEEPSFPWWLFWLLTGTLIGLVVGLRLGKSGRSKAAKRPLYRFQGRLMR
ncbi:hypothetical protein OS242_00690 [Tumebacillus sp. DT12]|uniref:DUF3592 domain-containing protein n=1 Tax=Tumebacillus lacus TaxID=2995335 RepID=A0ABT3WXJ3_9BACL|nr:hypothetical protein [Tumebacillus lacus]MCX7568482.1 hypothetical protein [Tumebacillus lacus]